MGEYEQRGSNTESSFGALQGKVTSEGDGIQFAQITIYDANQQEVAHLVSDKNGQFAIKPLREGTYYVNVEYQGRQSITKQSVYISKNNKSSVDLVLGQNERDLEIIQISLNNSVEYYHKILINSSGPIGASYSYDDVRVKSNKMLDDEKRRSK